MTIRSDAELKRELEARGVRWARESDPTLETLEDGRLRLIVCTSFSYDDGYSIFDVGEGATLDECVANLHDDPDFDA